MEDKLQYIREQLTVHDGEFDKVAYESKVSRRTISKVRHDDYAPSLRITNLLYKHLKKIEGK